MNVTTIMIKLVDMRVLVIAINAKLYVVAYMCHIDTIHPFSVHALWVSS
jgi:hypothetical protein